ncbi:DMT family transporter [Massilia endophytica]|uniref:DMT family transporter n=1 Tax=Massilia endophytica TaxID=2899220 RepID=UPI001E4596DE|nr:DMT family transporter [Massilia endophytica]UGQ44888.1 DMT family transporter [Massilia endophytica]
MEKRGGEWRLTVAMALSGTIGMLVVGSGLEPLTVVFFRCLIGGAALLGWLLLKRQWQALDRRAMLWLLGGAAALILNWLCLFSAYGRSSISVATVVYHVQPFFLILLGALLQRELPPVAKLAWLALAFAGVALAADIDLSGADTGMLAGALLALAAAFLYAIATLATRKLNCLAPAQIAGLQLIVGALVLAPFSRFSLDSLPLKAWSCVLTLGIVHTGLMYNLMYAAFQRLRTEAIATLSFIYPLVAIAVDVLFFDVVLSGAQVLGMAMILAAVLANQFAGKGVLQLFTHRSRS